MLPAEDSGGWGMMDNGGAVTLMGHMALGVFFPAARPDNTRQNIVDGSFLGCGILPIVRPN